MGIITKRTYIKIKANTLSQKMCIFSSSLAGFTLALPQEPQPLQRTNVCTRQVARISSVNETYGFLDYKVPEKYHRLSLTKNGAIELPENGGRLFFHKNDLFACCIDDLEIGHQVSFNVIHSKISNKYIAVRVKASVPNTSKSARQQIIVTPVCENKTAKIASVSKDFGFVSYKLEDSFVKLSLAKNGAPCFPENDGKIFFRYTGLYNCSMAELKPGVEVTFDVFHNKRSNRFIASRVCLVPEKKSISYAKAALLSVPRVVRSNPPSIDRRPSLAEKLAKEFANIRRTSIETQLIISQIR